MRQAVRWIAFTSFFVFAIGCGDPGDSALKKFERTVADIDTESAGAGYITSHSAGFGFIRYAGPRIAANPDGRLRVDVRYCRYEVSIDFDSAENSNIPEYEMVTEDTDCVLADAVGISVSLATLQDIDPEAIDVHGFMEDGTLVTELEALLLQLPQEGIYSLADSFAVIARCRDDESCIEYVNASEGSRLYIPCADQKSCEAIQSNLRLLIEFAADPEFSRVVSALKAKGYPATAIKNDRQAKKAAARITERLGLGGWFNFDLDTGENVGVAATGAEYLGEGVLSFESIYQVTLPGSSGVTTANGENRLKIAELNSQSMSLPVHSDETGWFIVLECAAVSCVEGQAGDLFFTQSAWIVPCKNQDDCEDITRDLRGLSAYAASKAKPFEKENDDKRNDEDKAASPNHDAPRSMRRSADALAAAINDSELRLSVSEGPMRRIMRGKGASVGGDYTLTVERDVCVALLLVDRPQWNGCEMESLFSDYNLKIELAELDASTIDSRAADANAGESGRWLSASCVPAQACAEIVIPADAHHGAKLQTETLMRSFREDWSAPFIRVPCRDEAACKQAEKALRGLAKEARKYAPKKKRRRGGDLVGIWELQSEHQTGWVTEFGANGKFVFTNPTSRTEGTYTAKDGKWSQRAPQNNFEDQGDYRFLDENTLELTGKYGVSVWKRRLN